MNLFRSEEHVNNWTQYDPVSKEAIMPLADWFKVFSGPVFRNRLEPDIIARTDEYMGQFFGALQELGRSGSFWLPE